MALSAVLFDMDGLLVDTEPLWLKAEYATMAELGGEWSPADQAAILGASMPHAIAYFQQRSGTDRDAQEVGDLLIGSMVALLREAPIAIQPGAAQLLHEVAASGVPFALVSASVRPIVALVLEALSRAGLPAFPVSVAGDEVERSKPDPMPYQRAAQLLGVDITRAVVLEDSANGVRSGAAAGALVVAVPHAVPIEPAPRISVRTSLEGLSVAHLDALVAGASTEP